jgi:dTMP kinase
VAAGTLIAIEGIDGAGKTTQVEMLVGALRAAGHEVVATKEPTSGPHGRRIRAMSTAGEPVSPADQLESFVADREEHVRDLIAPALARGAVVVTDRYYLSNVAYQGAGGLDPEEILARNEKRFPVPDAVVLIVVSPAEGLRRVRARGGELNQAFEREDFLERVAHVFARVSRPYVHRVDGEAQPAAVHAAVREALRSVVDLGEG